MARTAVRKRKPRIEVYEKRGALRFGILKLTPANQYAVLSAVRGPDIGYSDPAAAILKNRITERIRYIVFKNECPGSYRDDPMGLDAVEQVIRVSQEAVNRPTMGHYLSHLRLAIKATRKSKIWGGHADQLIAAFISMGAI